MKKNGWQQVADDIKEDNILFNYVRLSLIYVGIAYIHLS